MSKDYKFTLRDVIELNSKDYLCTKRYSKETGYLPQSVFTINLCCMCEQETWITAVPIDHPLLSYLYDIPVSSISPGDDKYSLDVWIPEEYWSNPATVPDGKSDVYGDGEKGMEADESGKQRN